MTQYKKQLEELAHSLDITAKEQQISTLEEQTTAEDFWQDTTNSQKVLKEIKQLKDNVDKYKSLLNTLEEIELSQELGADDPELLQEAVVLEKTFAKDLEDFYLLTLLSGDYDRSNAVISLNAGAGGTEACDWVEMLLRMYTRWANDKGYKVETLDYLAGDEAGVKSVTLEIDGVYAYGYLRSERGVHRLVRLSPFDAAGKRHTSFASCSVLPVIDDDITIDIKEEDLKIDTYRASGAGGQHVNTTDSAIRITHMPTGIVVQCQNERSQHKNKDSAMKILRAKLFEKQQQEQKDALKDIQGAESDIAWGSQIRSYVMHPYSMVKDHRTSEETGNVKAVMDGGIDAFISAYLKQ